MNSQNWAEKDIDRGIKYLADHETEAKAETVLATEEDITILLPSGLPAFGANISGIFMMAPLLLFLLILILFPIRILSSTRGLPITTVVLSVLCLLFAWGLTKAIQLMLKNRDLFPRCYFVTLGNQGIVMHFSRLQFPLQASRLAIEWREIQTVRRGRSLFIPALLFGNPWVTSLEVISKGGDKILIPFRLSSEKLQATQEKIESLISQKINR
ncbi:MAG: hypothetical protein NPINA01_08780 [Nitrospinaceae bacterium]|nr:MAG: hypothetical protein NPINA01_08780 [Nitrospinaceae bacterium]